MGTNSVNIYGMTRVHWPPNVLVLWASNSRFGTLKQRAMWGILACSILQILPSTCSPALMYLCWHSTDYSLQRWYCGMSWKWHGSQTLEHSKNGLNVCKLYVAFSTIETRIYKSKSWADFSKNMGVTLGQLLTSQTGTAWELHCFQPITACCVNT